MRQPEEGLLLDAIHGSYSPWDRSQGERSFWEGK